MPVQPTYPGVYIEEIPSGVRTITGVATSITAFLGRAVLGEVNEPVIIDNFGAFERLFGGLDVDHPMSYAVKDFYLNGGSQAIIVRLFRDGDREAAQEAAQSVVDAVELAAEQVDADLDSVSNAAQEAAGQFDADPEQSAAEAVAEAVDNAAGEADADVDDLLTAANNAVDGAVDQATPSPNSARTLTSEDENTELTLEAASPGAWGNRLSAKIDYDGIDDDVPDRYGLDLNADDFFNLTIVESPPDGPRERIVNLSVHPEAGSRDVGRVLEQVSQLVRVREIDRPDEPPEASRPAETPDDEDPTNSDNFADPTSINVAFFAGGRDSDALDRNLDDDGQTYLGSESDKTGLHALTKADLFNLLCIPADGRGGNTPTAVYQAAMEFCANERAMLIVDPPAEWSGNPETAAAAAQEGLSDLGLTGVSARNAALYFPRVRQGDPLREGQTDTFVPCGIVAGVMARTDVQRGVWKAPAGVDATLNGIRGLEVNLTDGENGRLNPLGVNCLRSFPIVGQVVWGARTLRGADQLADEYKYVPVRRLALFIEESLYRGTQWVVFEPNDEPLWAQIRLNVGAFMQNLFRQGAFQGTTPREAYFVKCDAETNPQILIDQGIVTVMVGFAPLKPAEFVIIQIQQMRGDSNT